MSEYTNENSSDPLPCAMCGGAPIFRVRMSRTYVKCSVCGNGFEVYKSDFEKTRPNSDEKRWELVSMWNVKQVTNEKFMRSHEWVKSYEGENIMDQNTRILNRITETRDRCLNVLREQDLVLADIKAQLGVVEGKVDDVKEMEAKPAENGWFVTYPVTSQPDVTVITEGAYVPSNTVTITEPGPVEPIISEEDVPVPVDGIEEEPPIAIVCEPPQKVAEDEPVTTEVPEKEIAQNEEIPEVSEEVPEPQPQPVAEKEPEENLDIPVVVLPPQMPASVPDLEEQGLKPLPGRDEGIKLDDFADVEVVAEDVPAPVPEDVPSEPEAQPVPAPAEPEKDEPVEEPVEEAPAEEKKGNPLDGLSLDEIQFYLQDLLSKKSA